MQAIEQMAQVMRRCKSASSMVAKVKSSTSTVRTAEKGILLIEKSAVALATACGEALRLAVQSLLGLHSRRSAATRGT